MRSQCFALALTLLTALTGYAAVTVKTYHVAGGEEVTSETWPPQLLQRIRKTDRKNPTSVNTAVVFTNRRKTIAIKYSGRETTNKKGEKQWTGQFGWVPPNANWYHDGFFRFTLNKSASLHHRFQLVETRSGDTGLARWVADMPDATATLEFSLRANDDKLLFHIRFEPKEQKAVSSAVVTLQCYPSDFAVQKPETRSRAALTSKRRLTPGPKGGSSRAEVSEEESWALFLDEYYDVAEGRGAGPCAVAWDVSRCDVTLRCGGYVCYALAGLKSGVTETSFVLWDFSGVTNADAITVMKALEVTPKP